MRSSGSCCAGLPVDSAQLRKGGADAVSCMGSSVFGFRDFLLKGKIIDLAVAVVVGGATLALVNAVVADIITPLIAAIAGQPNFANLTFTVHRSKFAYGDLINKALTFLFTCLIVYYAVVLPVSKLTAYFFPPTTCPECMETISAKATRCKYCCITIEPPIKMRKVNSFLDDAEVIVPLKTYNPETRSKISCHTTTTAKPSWSPRAHGQLSSTPQHGAAASQYMHAVSAAEHMNVPNSMV